MIHITHCIITRYSVRKNQFCRKLRKLLFCTYNFEIGKKLGGIKIKDSFFRASDFAQTKCESNSTPRQRVHLNSAAAWLRG